MSEKEKVLHEILTASQTGTIVCRIAKLTGLPIYDAFRRFFMSRTYAKFRTFGSIMSMLGDPAIVDAFLEENPDIVIKATESCNPIEY